MIAVFAAAICLALPSRAELADGIQAVVNDKAVTYGQVREFTAPAVEALHEQYAGQQDAFDQKLGETFKDSLEQLVERQLILHDFDTEGYKLPESVVDGLVQDRIRERFGDRITLMKTLQAQGETFEEFRKGIREQYIVSALRNKNVSQAIIISPYKVENYYQIHQGDFKIEDEIKLRMIVLKKTSADDTNTLNLAREIQAKIKGGAAFSEMETVYTQGSQQKEGDWYERTVLRKELADVAFNLKTGEVSDVIETPESCYLVLVEQTRPSRIKPLNEVRDDIEKTIRTQDQARIEKQWIDHLKKKTFIRIFS
ncbi:MAG TPA: peptidyl-prolyl cis-trans isomerase [Dongiaceae bacterium]|nr:peptidyl-prolyl cis-trans isomerase [Dongiaceae bacterium]